MEGQDIRADFMGRGIFTYDVPEDGKPCATFDYKGTHYRFALPDILQQGLTLHVDEGNVTLQGRGLSAKHLKVAFLTRGMLRFLMNSSPIKLGVVV